MQFHLKAQIDYLKYHGEHGLRKRNCCEKESVPNFINYPCAVFNFLTN